MYIQWFGQSAFLLTVGDMTIFIDPFGQVNAIEDRGMRWDYPPIAPTKADLLLVTHEHRDHNGVNAIVGSPQIIRSTAGTFETPIGTVIAIASEHDQVAGTKRGPNTIFACSFGGLRIAHMGDFGQAALRPEQRQAMGDIDLLFVPVGGMATIDGHTAATIARELHPTWIIPMHYRTAAINFLEPEQAFVEALHDMHIQRLTESVCEIDAPANGPSVVLIPAPPIMPA